jgi:uncharacterized OsmC-like protein
MGLIQHRPVKYPASGWGKTPDGLLQPASEIEAGIRTLAANLQRASGMTPLPHRYDVHLDGGPEGYARMSTPGVPDLRAAPPPQFGGPGDAWSPEHLLLASVQSCFLFTLRAVARASQLRFTHLEVDVTGIVERRDHVTRFTSIVLRPTVSVEPSTDRDLVRAALERSKKACLVSASLSTPVHLDARIVEVGLTAV